MNKRTDAMVRSLDGNLMNLSRESEYLAQISKSAPVTSPKSSNLTKGDSSIPAEDVYDFLAAVNSEADQHVQIELQNTGVHQGLNSEGRQDTQEMNPLQPPIHKESLRVKTKSGTYDGVKTNPQVQALTHEAVQFELQRTGVNEPMTGEEWTESDDEAAIKVKKVSYPSA